jgi:undecaprenyl diphosphate synthase
MIDDSLTPPDPLPRHVVIVMDGNGRWAQQRACHAPWGIEKA